VNPSMEGYVEKHPVFHVPASQRTHYLRPAAVENLCASCARHGHKI
jgi:hypothetical protein